MDEIDISKFKANCLAVLERVRKTRKPVLVTRFGQPVAEVIPPSPKPDSRRRLGAMAGTARIVGDIISPATDAGDWEIPSERPLDARVANVPRSLAMDCQPHLESKVSPESAIAPHVAELGISSIERHRSKMKNVHSRSAGSVAKPRVTIRLLRSGNGPAQPISIISMNNFPRICILSDAQAVLLIIRVSGFGTRRPTTSRRMELW
jgi:prevent-host-death family protein